MTWGGDVLAPSSRLLARRALRKHPGLVGTIGALSLIFWSTPL